MADYSRRPHRGFAKQFSSVFGSKGVYDDVFKTRAPSSSSLTPPVVRDYAEIFNSSQPSSIPILELDDFDTGNESKLDYGNVFGGTGDGQIGWTAYAEVFCVAADGGARATRRTDDSLSHSRGSDHSTALEGSQQQTHESLFGRKHTMSYDKITRDGKRETDEITGQAKNIDVSVSINATVPLKSAEVSTSDAAIENLKRSSNEASLRKHSRNISSGGLSKHEIDDFIEIDVISGNEYGSGKHVSSGMAMEVDRSEEPTFEVISSSDFVLHLGGPNAAFSDQASLRSNAREDSYVVSISSTGDEVKLQSEGKPFVRDSAMDDNVSGQNLLTQDHVGACATPDILMGNLNACSSNAIEKAEDGSQNLQQDVKLQTVNDLGMPFIGNYQINASMGMPQESSGLTPPTCSLQDFDKLNAASDVGIVSEIVVSRNANSDCDNRDSIERLTSNVDLQSKVLGEMTSIDMPVDSKVINLESENSNVISPSAVQCNLGNVGPAVKSSTILSGGFANSTYSKATDDHLPSSSDDEIDKNSEAAVYASAVKRAIREAQVWINIAKESNGVKGFMKPVVAKTFGLVKVAKEVHNSKVKETRNLCKLEETTIENNCSMTGDRKDYIDTWSTSSKIKMTPAYTAGEEITFKGTVFCVSDGRYQKEDVVVDDSSEEGKKIASTIQFATPLFNTSGEKLVVYNNEEDLKSVPEKGDATMRDMDDSDPIRIDKEANCCKEPKDRKTEILVISTDNHDALFNDYDDTSTVTGTNEAENESHETLNVGYSAISIEVTDLVSGTGHMAVHHKQNEAIKADRECVGTPCSDNDLTSLGEENVNKLGVDPHDQLSDCEDFQDYASAEENFVSTDTDDEITEKDSNLPAQNQISEIKDKVMQHMMAPEAISIKEDVFSPCNLNEKPTVEESHENEVTPLQNNETRETEIIQEDMAELILVCSAEDPVFTEADEGEDKQLQDAVTHDVASEARTETFFKNSNKKDVDMEPDVTVVVPMINMVTPETKNTPEDGITPCFNVVGEDPRVEETDEVEVMTEKNMVVPGKINISESDVAFSFDNSNADLIDVEIEADTTSQSIVTSPRQELEKGVVGDTTFYILEHTKLEIEELKSVPSVEFSSNVEYACSHSHGLEAEQICIDNVTEKSVADTIEETRSVPHICDYEKQEMDAACLCNLEPRTQDREELQDILIIEAEIIEKGQDTINVESVINDQSSIDAAAQEDAIKLESTPLHPEHDNHGAEAGILSFKSVSDNITNEGTTECDNWISELVDNVLESGKQFSEPLPDTTKNEETSEFDQQVENLFQPVERHGRKKWEIPKESSELPELKVGILETHDTAEQDSFEVKRQMDKHERKKWEIPQQTFELPVLGDDGIVEENEEIAGQDGDNDTTSAEKPERKKWDILKEVHEVPVWGAKAVKQMSGHDGFVIITASKEEMRVAENLPTNLTHSEESSQHYGLRNEIFAKEELVVPDKGVYFGFCVDNSQECTNEKSLPEMQMLDEKEQENQLNETSDQLKGKVEEGNSDKQGECAKVLEDINVKDEIKRTLGMLWKRIYKSKHDEDFGSVELRAQEEDTFRRVVDKDLNLEGPVELVESPRQQDNIEVLKSFGQSGESKEITEETSYFKQFEVNRCKPCSCDEFISSTGLMVEAQGNTLSASHSCKLQEDENKNLAEETSNKNYNRNANDLESPSESIQSVNGPENIIPMEQIHEAEESQRGETLKTEILPSDVNECGRTDCEMVSRFEALLPDDSILSDAKNSRKVKQVFLDNGSKEDETVKTTSKDEALQENDAEDYFEDEVEALLPDEFSDRSSTKSEQQDITSSGQDSYSIPDRQVADGASSNEQEKADPDMSSWEGVFREGEESRNASNKQDEPPEISLLHSENTKIKIVAGEINISQLTVKETLNDDEPPETEERAKGGVHKEVTPNQEFLQNIFKAKERERTVVDRAVREARERAFAEARERAATERAKAEAHQKPLVNNQERLPKALSETKLSAEENPLEAKRKAEFEHAAVERATAEARQRSLEKAMSQKEQTSQGSSSRFASASNYQYGPSSEDRLNDDNSSESALRFKATNERDQRIAERAAKAIEDKNMRDLLFQREQDERNRLADVLDAEFKKWANGKTGNLRALLSTLQYVLGPDCGWQPIHLTDIVTTDAVKKAYRKATLFVHPDKLQQRGATIKQKYICEKVFDLLKEAWNMFDRDER